nr:hypothetical protein CFP56_13135 [Quercus suber]
MRDQRKRKIMTDSETLSSEYGVPYNVERRNEFRAEALHVHYVYAVLGSSRVPRFDSLASDLPEQPEARDSTLYTAMEQRKWLPTNVCQACLQIFENAVPGKLSKIHPNDGRAWHFEGLPSLHRLMESVHASALGGCIVCALISRTTREAVDLQKNLVDLAVCEASLDDHDVSRHIQVRSMNDRNKKFNLVRSEQRGNFIDTSLSDLDRIDSSLCASGRYGVETDLPKIRSLGHESCMHYAFELQVNHEDSDRLMYELTLYLRTALSVHEDWLHIVEWTNIDDHASASQARSDSASPETMTLARQWLTCCQTTHSLCNSHGVSSTFAPTRLMKLEGLAARLIDSSLEQLSSGYVALSHCWGTEKFLSLSTSTLEALRKGLPIASFPSSFSDAMVVTQSMGFEYIWIDCYCIFQGNDEFSRRDWDAESQLMHLVYSNSAFTIGASHASSPYDGCFITRSPDDNNFAVLEWSPDGADSKRKFRVAQHDGVYPSASDVVWDEPLFQRGWCVQERILCRRMLLFSRKGIVWLCAQCPTATERCPSNYGYGSSQAYSEVGPGMLSAHLAKGSVETRLHFWDQLLSEYTRCALSHPAQDKLRAIDGVAQRMCELFDYNYVLGHFWEHLPYSLCWYSYCTAFPSDRTLPSWTWASLDGGLTFPYSTNDHDGSKIYPLATIVSPSSAEELNASSSTNSTLTFIGKLLCVKIIDLVAKEKAQDYTSRIGTPCWHLYAIFDVEAEKQELWTKQSWFYMFPICCFEGSSMSHTVLLVTPRPDGTFRRLGIADYWSRNPEKNEKFSYSSPPLWMQEFRHTRPTLIMLS